MTLATYDHLDGNAAAGELSSIFAIDVTAAEGQCANCGATKRFAEAPKPIPTSFAREAFFAVTSFKFTNAQGISRHGRFRIRPERRFQIPS